MRIIGDRECKKYALCCNGCAKIHALLLYQQRYAPSGETKEICTLLSIQNDMTLVIWLLRTPRAATVAVIDGSLVLWFFSSSVVHWFLAISRFFLVIDDHPCFFTSSKFQSSQRDPVQQEPHTQCNGTSESIIVDTFAFFSLIPLNIWFHNLLFIADPPHTGSGR